MHKSIIKSISVSKIVQLCKAMLKTFCIYFYKSIEKVQFV